METHEVVASDLERTLEEFSVFELDERLEFVAWCDKNCACTSGSGAS
jgi:hypothetical protein